MNEENESDEELSTSNEDERKSPEGNTSDEEPYKEDGRKSSDATISTSKEEQLKSSIKSILGKNFDESIDVKTSKQSSSVNIFITVKIKGSKDDEPNVAQEPGDQQFNQLPHSKSRTKKSRLQCTFCGKVMSSDYRLQCHVRKHTGASAGKCTFCEKNFSDGTSLKRHYRTCQREKSFPCQLCGLIFTSQKWLDKHIVIHSFRTKKDSDEEIFTCGVCNRTFSSNEKLKLHEKSHISIGNNKELGNTDLVEPFDDLDEEPNDNPDDDPLSDEADDPLLPDPPSKPGGNCRFCGKFLTNPRRLKDHETGHTRENPITCLICDKIYYNPQSARTHFKRCEVNARLGTRKQGNAKLKIQEMRHQRVKNEEFSEKDENNESHWDDTRSDHDDDFDHDDASIDDSLLHETSSKSVIKFGKALSIGTNLKYHEIKKSPIVCLLCDKVFHNPKTARDHIKKCEENSHLSSESQDNIKQEAEECDVKMVIHEDWNSENLMGEKAFNDGEIVAITQSTPGHLSDPQPSDDPVLNCAVCDEVLENRKCYGKHMRSKHPGENTVVCQFCGRTCHYKSMPRHLKTCKLAGIKQEIATKKTVCTECGKSVRCLTNHMRVHTGEKPYQCLECGERFSQNGLLTRHKRYVHTDVKLHKCSMCKKEFKHKLNLTTHMRIHTEEEHPFQCDVCHKCLSSEYALKVHKKTHIGNKEFLCTICGKAFKQMFNLNLHRSTVHNIAKPYSCDKCGGGFLKMHFLVKHQRSCDNTPTTASGGKRFKCDICAKTVTLSNAKNHMRTHTGEKPFVCSICGKAFAQQVSYKFHMMNHSGERPFQCDQCEKQFKSMFFLKYHMRSHTGETPFKCDICGREFNRYGNLARHKKIHDDKRPYECKTCGMAFKLFDILKHHERRHTGEKPFKCSLCDRAFSDSRPLKKHMLMHAENKIEPKNLVQP